MAVSLLKAVPGDGALANEVVLGGGIIVLHNKADKGKLRHNHFKLELCVPPWVEAVVSDDGSLVTGHVSAHTMDLHCHLGVYDRVLILVDFWQLLP